MSSTVTRCVECGKKNRVPAVARGRPTCAVCADEMPWVADAGDGDWAEVVEASPLPVLVDFWAEWCGPCRTVSPVLEQLARELRGRIKLVKVDVDRSPALSARFAVQSIPTLAIFQGDRLVARQAGAAGADRLRAWIESALSGDRSGH